MEVSGFSFIRNAIIYDYPIIESIQSLLPIVDEYVIAVGRSEDKTRDIIESLNSDRIKIVDTVWNDSMRQGALFFSLPKGSRPVNSFYFFSYIIFLSVIIYCLLTCRHRSPIINDDKSTL